MSNPLQAIRGMHDVLPHTTPHWQYVERILRELLQQYGYQEIRLPIVEKTELFQRSIGEVTDIIEKEMYTFEDRNGDSLSLRPEGTAGCLRACLEHSLLHHQTLRLWYYGPMFRHERPQKGRYRQFVQWGVEAYGMPGPDIDAELILMTRRLWQRVGLGERLQLQLNTLGTVEERLRYRERLIAYFGAHQDQLDEDSRRRLTTNPLRILDSKNPALRELIDHAPLLHDELGEDSLTHFTALTRLLDAAGVRYTINPYLVRGLDYYSKTVFEWVTDELGAQGTVCAGGRYDGLIEQLGGKANHAIGFAMGMERLLALLETAGKLPETPVPHAYLIRSGPETETLAMRLAERLRDQLPTLRLLMHCGESSIKSQFKKADKSGARYALILGEDEARAGMLSIKPLRNDDAQQTLPLDDAIAWLARHLALDTTLSERKAE